MPILPYDQAVAMGTGEQPQEAPDVSTYRTPPGQSFDNALDASPIGSTARWIAGKFDPTGQYAKVDPKYDPFDGLEDRYADYADSFVDAHNAADGQRIKARIDHELWRNEQGADTPLLSLSGAAGLAGGLVGDPAVLIPGGVGLKAAGLGGRVLESAATTAAIGAGASAADELLLHQTEETRTWQDSAVNVALTSLLGGAIGAAAPLLGAGVDKAGETLASRVATPRSAAETAVDSYVGGSLSAAAPVETTLKDEGLKSSFGLDKVLAPTSPLLRAAASPSIATRRIMQQLAEDGLIRAKNSAGVASDISATRRIEIWKGNLADGLVGLDDAFTRHRLGRSARLGDETRIAIGDLTGRTGDLLTRRDFSEAVGQAMIRGDESHIPEVAEAAKHLRATIFDPLKEEAVSLGMLPEGVHSEVATSYLTRLYDRDEIAAHRKQWIDKNGDTQDGFEDILHGWLGGQRDVAASELRAVEAAVAKHSAALDALKAQAQNTAQAAGQSALQGGGDAAALAEETRRLEGLLSKARGRSEELRGVGDASDSELRSIAQEVTDKILHNANYGLGYEAVPIERGPIKELTLTIPTRQIEGFLEKDAEKVARVYHRTMSTDIELTRVFGKANMEDQIAKVNDDYARLRKDVTDPKKLYNLEKRQKADLRDISAVRDRVRGTYAMPEDPNSLFYRIARTTKALNFLRQLGGMTVSSISDAMRPVMLHGAARVMRGGLAPMLTNLKGYKLAAEEAKHAGAALEMVLDGRAHSMFDLTDEFRRHSKFERGVDLAVSKYGLATFMSPWTDFWKRFVGVVSQSRTLEALEKWQGGSLGKRDLERISQMGIDEGMGRRIHEQFLAHGEKQAGGVRWANTQAWTDAEAATAYRAALGKEIDIAIVQPGQEKPLWLSTPLGSVIGQFQSYNLAAMQRVLMAGLQQRDAAALQGFVGMSMAGMLAVYLRGYIASASDHDKTLEERLPQTPAQWAVAGADQGGAFGYLFQLDHAVDVASRGNLSLVRAVNGGQELSRYSQRQGLAAFGGPTVGFGADLFTAAAAAGTRDWSKQDVKALRRLLPGQNLFYARWLFDQAEHGMDDAVVK